MGTGVVCGGSRVVACNGAGARWWSGLSPHLYETGGMRRVWVRGHENVRKRVLIQAAACNIGLLLRRQTGVGTPRSLQGRAVSAICRLNRASDRPLGASEARLGVQMDPDGARRLNRSSAHRQVA